jgi:hypothetical protein
MWYFSRAKTIHRKEACDAKWQWIDASYAAKKACEDCGTKGYDNNRDPVISSYVRLVGSSRGCIHKISNDGRMSYVKSLHLPFYFFQGEFTGPTVIGDTMSTRKDGFPREHTMIIHPNDNEEDTIRFSEMNRKIALYRRQQADAKKIVTIQPDDRCDPPALS